VCVEHHHCCSIEALVSQGSAKFFFKESDWHIVQVDGFPRHYERVEVGPPGRCGVDVGTKRMISPGYGVRVKENTPQYLVFPVGGNLVRWMSVRAEHGDERQFLSSNPSHTFSFLTAVTYRTSELTWRREFTHSSLLIAPRSPLRPNDSWFSPDDVITIGSERNVCATMRRPRTSAPNILALPVINPLKIERDQQAFTSRELAGITAA
jgi:hypothetical protein